MKTVTALVPAHNEAVGIVATIRSLQAQTIPPDRIVVVADNCTDGTAELAQAAGAEVFTTVGNTARKAGALNQALAALEPEGDVLVMDADTTLAEQFIEVAKRQLHRDGSLGAVGAVFRGDGRGFLEQCQVNEWARYARQVGTTGKVWVLSGTAALIRGVAWRGVAAQRGRTLPGRPGEVYLDNALTEDMELTVALKTLGWRLASPLSCTTTTELMPTWRSLWRQRLRWYGGALETLRRYGPNATTLPYLWQQVMLGLSVVFIGLFIGLTIFDATVGTLALSWFWFGVTGIFWAERVVTAWRNPRGRLLAALLWPELGYAMFLQACFAVAVLRQLFGRDTTWTHLVTQPQTTTQKGGEACITTSGV